MMKPCLVVTKNMRGKLQVVFVGDNEVDEAKKHFNAIRENPPDGVIDCHLIIKPQTWNRWSRPATIEEPAPVPGTPKRKLIKRGR